MLRLLPITLLTEAVHNKDEIQALALAFSIKSRYRSSQYRISYSRIAEEYHIGRDKAKRLIRTLRDMEMLKDTGKTILFKKFRQGRGKHFEIQPYNNLDLYNLKEVEKYLRLQAVNIKQCQIDYAANKLEHLHNPKTLKQLKSAGRRANSNWVGDIDRGQSIATVSRASGLGKNSAVQLLNWGEKKKLLVKQKRVRRVNFYDHPEGKGSRSTVFTWHGIKFLAQSTVLIFCVL